MAALLPMVKGMLAAISPTPNLAADETNPQVLHKTQSPHAQQDDLLSTPCLA